MSLAVLRLPQLHAAPGRNLYAVGGNPVAARYCGIEPAQAGAARLRDFGRVAGLCGYLWVSRYGVAYSEIANGYELTVIAACVIGGVSIGGGIGSVAGTLLGALFLGIVMTALPVLQISPFWQMAISGAVILAAVVINARAERRPDKLILPEARRLGRDTRRSGRTRMNVVDPKIAGEPLHGSLCRARQRAAALARRRCCAGRSSSSCCSRRRSSSTRSSRPTSSTSSISPTPPSISRRRRSSRWRWRCSSWCARSIFRSRRSSRSPSMAIGYAAEAGFGPGALFAVGHRRRPAVRRLQRLPGHLVQACRRSSSPSARCRCSAA